LSLCSVVLSIFVLHRSVSYTYYLSGDYIVQPLSLSLGLYEAMPAVNPDDDDEFYGDQSSVDCSDSNSYAFQQQTSSQHEFGNIANHEYRSHETSIKTLSYLDGYDETKEERIQDGFSNGYKQSFHDAYNVGCNLGSLCARAALDELKMKPDSEHKDATTNDDKVVQTTQNDIEHTAKLVRAFLKDQVLVTKEDDAEKRYHEALSKLKDELEKSSIQ
jgi:hypothetical protein